MQPIQLMKTLIRLALAALGLAALTCAGALDPRTNSWLTTYAGRYARIYTSDTARANGAASTTWTNGTTYQSLPAYCGIQEVDSSASWVYLKSSGLASVIMGPWYLNAAHTQNFPNYPTNQKLLYRIPRSPAVPATKTVNGGGQIGIFVDGVEMFNSWDAYTWNGSADAQNASGYWNRDAYVNEGVTFDANNAHQAGGTHHYHANPPGLRYLLGDHVDFNSVTKSYTESTNAPTRHSPILGWVADGFPIYGPYGYSNPTNPASGLRRMISGYVLRNGQYGTSNLTVTGRSTLPQWAVRLYNVSSNQAGPSVSTSYPLGRYMEDNDYLGDLGYTQGVDFDLDEHNGRYCVTPEFPNGTYAYFVAIAADGTPVFPYNIGRGYYGTPSGGMVSAIAETVTTNFLGGTNLPSIVNAPSVKSGTVTLTWSALEGGTYQVETGTNLTSWNLAATNLSPNENVGGFSTNSVIGTHFFRVARTALASYDPTSGTTSTGGGAGATITLSPASANRGTTNTVTATLSSSATPPVPPSGAGIASFTIGSLAVTGATHISQYVVSGTVVIPNDASLVGAQTVSIQFSPPMGQTQGPTYTQTAGFTIN